MIISYVHLPLIISPETSNESRLICKTIFQVCLLQVQYFSQLDYVNTRPTKLESYFQHFPSSSYAFYKIETILKALNQLNLIPLEKYPKQQVSYFYQILHFMMNLKKIGSLNLDIPRSSYEFLKFATKSRNINKEKFKTLTDSWAPWVNGPMRQRDRSEGRR